MKFKDQSPSNVDDLPDAQDIADKFRDKFSSTTARHIPQRIRVEAAQSRWYTNFLSSGEVERSLKNLIKVIGSYWLHSKHLNFLDRSNLNCIKMLLKACLSYGFVIAGKHNGLIKPRVKNKFRDTSASDFYRKIMFSTNLYKLLEYCMLPIMERKVYSETRISVDYNGTISDSWKTTYGVRQGGITSDI